MLLLECQSGANAELAYTSLAVILGLLLLFLAVVQ